MYNQLNIGAIPGNVLFFNNSDILGGIKIHYSRTHCFQENIQYFGNKLKEKSTGKINNIEDKEFDISESIKFGCKNELFYITNDRNFLQKGDKSFLIFLTKALVKILPYVINPSCKELAHFKQIEATSLENLMKKEVHICDDSGFLNDHFDFLLAWRKLVKCSK